MSVNEADLVASGIKVIFEVTVRATIFTARELTKACEQLQKNIEQKQMTGKQSLKKMVERGLTMVELGADPNDPLSSGLKYDEESFKALDRICKDSGINYSVTKERAPKISKKEVGEMSIQLDSLQRRIDPTGYGDKDSDQNIKDIAKQIVKKPELVKAELVRLKKEAIVRDIPEAIESIDKLSNQQKKISDQMMNTYHVFFEAKDAHVVNKCMKDFLTWQNSQATKTPLKVRLAKNLKIVDAAKNKLLEREKVKNKDHGER